MKYDTKIQSFIVKEVAGREFESSIEDAQTVRRTIPIINNINSFNANMEGCTRFVIVK